MALKISSAITWISKPSSFPYCSKDEVISEYLKSHPNITNISQIARGCGVSRPTVYKYFKAQNIENLATNTDVPNDNINYLEHGNIDSVIPDDEDYLPY